METEAIQNSRQSFSIILFLNSFFWGGGIMIKIKPKSNSPFSSTYPATEAMNADVIREADDRGAGSTWRRIMCALSLASTSSGEEKFIF